MSKLKNTRHEKFCLNIIAGQTETEAYINAGYKEKGARHNASRLITYDNIKKRIQELTQEIKKDKIITAEKLLEYMSTALNLNPVEILSNGKLLDFGKFIDKIEFDNKGKIKKVWFVSKAKQVELLAKYHKLLSEKIEHTGEITSNISLKDFKKQLEKTKKRLK